MPVVSVIGSEGGLGKPVCRALAERYSVRRVDTNAPNELDCVRADVRAQEDMERAVAGVDIVVHLAAFHGGYFPPPTDETRFDVNVVGTFRMFQACVKLGVRSVVWASSMAALHRGDFYCISKVLGEDLCDFYRQKHGFRIAMLRFGSFTPADVVSYLEKMLRHGVDRRDCVAATVQAVDALATGRDVFGRFPVMPVHPCSADEGASFGSAWQDVLRRLDPDYGDLVRRYAVSIPSEVHQIKVSETAAGLGASPERSFADHLADLKVMDLAGAVRPDSPRWRFEQGVSPPAGIVWPACLR